MAIDRTEDRRKPWDGTERRGCYFDPATAAQTIAEHLDAYQIERDQRRSNARYEALGRAVFKRGIYLVGAIGVYYSGHQKVVTNFVLWLMKTTGGE